MSDSKPDKKETAKRRKSVKNFGNFFKDKSTSNENITRGNTNRAGTVTGTPSDSKFLKTASTTQLGSASPRSGSKAEQMLGSEDEKPKKGHGLVQRNFRKLSVVFKDKEAKKMQNEINEFETSQTKPESPKSPKIDKKDKKDKKDTKTETTENKNEKEEETEKTTESATVQEESADEAPKKEEQEPPKEVEESENIWDEKDRTQNLVLQSENFYDPKCGTLNKLVERLAILHTSDSTNYNTYVKVFFMTYRSFAAGIDVLAKLITLFNGIEGETPEEAEARDPPQSKIKKAVCLALAHWFTHHFKDFSTSNELKKAIQEFIQTSTTEKKEKDATYLAKMVEKKLNVGTYSSLFDSSVMVENPPPPILPANWKTMTFMDLDETEIARQLTIAEYHIYAEIQPVELQDLAWSKAKLKWRAPNVLSLIGRFNMFSNIIATVVVQTPTFKQRKRIVEKCVKIALKAYEMNNFNSAMAVVSGFNNSAIWRLKHTFAGISKEAKKNLTFLNEALSSENAYKQFRAIIGAAKPPCIPFLGVYLTDLTFVEDGNPDKVQKMINFRKRKLEYDVIIQVLKFQDRAYNYKLVPKIISFINKMPALGENELYKLSLECEPRKAKKKDLK